MKKKIKVVLLLVLCFILAGAALYAIPINSCTVKGTTRYSSEEIFCWIYPTEMERHWVVQKIRRLLGREKKYAIPFIESYEIEYPCMSQPEVTVYEKDIIAYMSLMENYFYLDAQGYVVEITKELKEGVPYVSGLSFQSAVLNQPLPVKEPKVFQTILSIANEIKRRSLQVDKLRFTMEKGIFLEMDQGDILVYLGDEKNITGKLIKLSEIYTTLEGKRGTLYLNSYSSDDKDKDIIFKMEKEEEPETKN